MHLLVGTYELFDFRNLDGQAARRGRDLHFPRYHVERKQERLEFVGALRYLLEQVPLTCDVDSLLIHWRTFADLSIGCIGILRDWMVDTVAGLMAEDQTLLTIEALQRYALHPAQRYRLEMEARTGERNVESGNAASRQQLEELLRKPVNGRKASSSSEAPAAEPNVIDQSPAQTKGRVIERAPSRDPVGETVLAPGPGKCSFKGIIDLSPAAMKEAGISRVECPECATTRSLDTEGSQVRFPPHDKRKTHTPNREERWVMQATVWKLAQKRM